MGYKVTSKIRIDLSDMGTDQNGNDFFVEIQNPKLMLWEQRMEAGKFAVPEGKVLTAEEMKEKSESMKAYVFSFMKSWNLLDLNTEQPLTLESPAVLDKVPAEVIERILGAFKNEAEKQSEEQKN